MSALSCHSEVLDQHLDRQPALHLELAEDAGSGFFKHRLRQIGRDDFNPPPRQCGEFLDAHRDRVRLLPGRGGCTPDTQAAAAGARLQKCRQHRLPQVIERNLVAEKEGLVGGHRLDHLRCQRVGSTLNFLHELGDSGEPDPSRQRDQSAFNQILLVGRQVQTGSLFQELTQELIVQRRHERSPENND